MFNMRHSCNGSFQQKHTSTFRKEKSSSTPAAGFAVVFRAAVVEFRDGGTEAGVIIMVAVALVVVALVVAVLVVVALVVVVLVLAVVGVVIILEFLTIAARNEARVDGKKPI
jgi:multidrug efflux pump subunit AcrB